MSLIGKKLLLNECLESCSAEQLASLQSLTDSLGTPTLLRLSTLTTSDKGVKYVTCWLDNYTVVHGLFIYTDTKCGLFAFQDEFNNMEAIKIDPVNKNFEYVHEHLSATEFRSTLDDIANTGSSGGEKGLYIRFVKLYRGDDDSVVELNYLSPIREIDTDELNVSALIEADGARMENIICSGSYPTLDEYDVCTRITFVMQDSIGVIHANVDGGDVIDFTDENSYIDKYTVTDFYTGQIIENRGD